MADGALAAGGGIEDAGPVELVDAAVAGVSTVGTGIGFP